MHMHALMERRRQTDAQAEHKRARERERERDSKDCRDGKEIGIVSVSASWTESHVYTLVQTTQSRFALEYSTI
jgi:hypothetical protein